MKAIRAIFHNFVYRQWIPDKEKNDPSKLGNFTRVAKPKKPTSLSTMHDHVLPTQQGFSNLVRHQAIPSGQARFLRENPEKVAAIYPTVVLEKNNGGAKMAKAKRLAWNALTTEEKAKWDAEAAQERLYVASFDITPVYVTDNCIVLQFWGRYNPGYIFGAPAILSTWEGCRWFRYNPNRCVSRLHWRDEI
jgi:hypothetical protein